MNEQDSLLAAIDEDVCLRTYDPAWTSQFRSESERLVAALPGAFLDIQHIGSTAVPGLLAKPIIDMLAGVESMAVAEALVAPICSAGYTTSAEFNATLVDRRWFMRWADGHRTHHLHVVALGSDAWLARIHFRDALRSSPELATRYAALKLQLAARHKADREAYTDAKLEFVNSVLQAV